MKPTTLGAAAAAAALAMFAPGVAAADPPTGPVMVPLDPVNGSTAYGLATLTPMPDGALRVQLQTWGMVPNSPHAAHIHGELTGQDFGCAPAEADSNRDGYVSTPEGVPYYGPVLIALTTEGDTTPASELALDRFPVADQFGNLTYDRTIPAADMPPGTLDELPNLVVAAHGVDVDDTQSYNIESPLGTSSFAESKNKPGVPMEATLPATCGAVPGAATGTPPSATGTPPSATGQQSPSEGSQPPSTPTNGSNPPS